MTKHSAKECLVTNFSQWYGEQVVEKDVSPQIRENLVHRYIHNTVLDKKGNKIPVPLCYECGRGRGEGSNYCGGACLKAGVIWTCKCGHQGVEIIKWTNVFDEPVCITRCPKCHNTFNMRVGGRINLPLPYASTKRKDPDHVPKWKKARILPKP